MQMQNFPDEYAQIGGAFIVISAVNSTPSDATDLQLTGNGIKIDFSHPGYGGNSGN